MKKLSYLLTSVMAAALLASCSMTAPIAATSNPLGSKTGKSSGTCYLTVLCFNVDASVATAAKNGGISKISTVDFNTKTILGIVTTYTTTVTGE